MLRVLGHRKRLCDGLTRRDLLRVGGAAGLMGLAPGAIRAEGSSLPRFGQAKSCILLFLYGSPSQLETFDPKPDAPEGIRGELGGAIATSIPGVSIAQGLPKLSRAVDRATIVRSVTHPYPLHGVAYALSGWPRLQLPMELNPRDPGHYPFLGSMVAFGDGHRPSEVPGNLLLPWAFSSRRVGEVPRAGPYAGFLGSSYNPIALEFFGEGTAKAKKTLNKLTWDDFELYRGITPASRFGLPGRGEGEPIVSLDALNRRRSLLEQIESVRKADAGTEAIDPQRAQAYRMLASEKFRRAFDLGAESAETRELYGMTLLGQSTLTARRLVEAGGRFISVFWDEYGLAGTGWDTHWDHFPRMKDELLPGLDQTLSGLLVDLDRRGLLDETLVLCLSEHGRTPKIATSVQGGGRDHWSRCYSVLMAGGGIARGRVIGRSDKIASDPVENLVSPKDILATACHLLGVPPDLTGVDLQQRPIPLMPEGRVLVEALA